MSKNNSGNSSKQKPFQQSAGGGAQTAILHLLTSKSVRETVESIVVAFALAFLFRTFEAEAFVEVEGAGAGRQAVHLTAERLIAGREKREGALRRTVFGQFKAHAGST